MDLEKFVIIFSAFLLLSPLRNGQDPSFEQNWIPITQGRVLLPLVEITPLVFEKTFLKFSQCIFAISLLSLLETGRDPSFEQIWVPVTKGMDALCQVWLNLAQWFLRRFLSFIKVFQLFCNYLLLEKGMALHLKKLEFPLPRDALCQVWLKLTHKLIGRKELDEQRDSHIYNSELRLRGCTIIYHALYIEKKNMLIYMLYHWR